MKRILFDSSLYIQSLRQSEGSLLLARGYGGALLHLSSVVVEELYAGAADASTEKAIEKLHLSFHKAQRIVTPNDSDWVRAGNLLAAISRKYGHEQVGRARLTNDILIAVSASRLGIAVATLNAGDFLLIQEFHPFNIVAVKLQSSL